MPAQSGPSLSTKEAAILRLLLEHGELYGLKLVELSNGEIVRGTVYVALGRMDAKGFVTSRQEERPAWVPGMPRRLYRISGLGERVLRAHGAASAAWRAVLPGMAT